MGNLIGNEYIKLNRESIDKKAKKASNLSNSKTKDISIKLEEKNPDSINNIKQITEQDWEKEVEKSASSLSDMYPYNDIDILDSLGNEDIKNYILSLKGYDHVAIAKKFLEGMTSDKKTFLESKKAIDEILKQLDNIGEDINSQIDNKGIIVNENGEMSIWTKHKFDKEDYIKKFFDIIKNGGMVKYYKEKGGWNITRIETPSGVITISIVKRLNYSPGSNLAELAKLSRIDSVYSFIGNIQGRMNQIRGDSLLDKEEIARTLSQMSGVIRCAKVKINALKKEELMETLKSNALKQKENEKAEKIERQLKQRRTSRKSYEYAQISKGFSPISLNSLDNTSDLCDSSNMSAINIPEVDISSSAIDISI